MRLQVEEQSARTLYRSKLINDVN